MNSILSRLSRWKNYLTPGNITGLYGLFMLTAFLLWVPESGYKDIVAPKHRLFLLSAAVFLGALAVVCVLRLLTCRDQSRLLASFRQRRSLTLPMGLALGLILWFLLSALVTDYPNVVWLGDRRNEGAVTLCLYMLLFILAAWFWSPRSYHALGASLTGIFSFILALTQFLGDNPLGLYPGELTFHHRGERYSGEYMGTIGNSDLLSAMLTMVCLYLLGSYCVSKRKERWFFLAGGLGAWGALLLSEVLAGPVAILGCLALVLPLCVGKGLGLRRMGEIGAGLSLLALGKSALGYSFSQDVLTIYPTWSLTSWLLLGIALLSALAAVLLRRLPEGRGYPRIGKAMAGFYVLLILAVFLFLFFYSGSNETLLGLHQLARLNPPDTLGSSRIAIWKDAVALGLDKPLFGGGPDTYNYRSDLIFTREFPDREPRRTSVDAAHNEYLNLWVNCGLPAMVLQIALILAVVIPAGKRLDRRKLPLLLPVVGYGLHALFGISQSLVSPLFYLFLGACCGTRLPEVPSHRDQIEE